MENRWSQEIIILLYPVVPTLYCTPFTSFELPGLKFGFCQPNPEFAEPHPVVEDNPAAVVGAPKLTTEDVPVPKFGVGLLMVP